MIVVDPRSWNGNKNRAWTAENEITFIKGLGSWSICSTSRKTLLLGYAVALERRRVGFSWADLLHIRFALDMALGSEGLQPRGRSS